VLLAQRGHDGDHERAMTFLEAARELAATNHYANVERRAVAALEGLADA
jgi:hypothetical protein